MTKPHTTPGVRAATETDTLGEIRTRTIPPYNVILLNDDHHSMEFVMEVLTSVLGVAPERAYQFMMEAHESGRAIIWTGSREVAELKHEQITSMHEIRPSDNAKLGPLGCDIEPA